MGGELQETYFKLHDLGFDAFSTDYPSVMFKVIEKLKKWRGGEARVDSSVEWIIPVSEKCKWLRNYAIAFLL